MFYDINTLLDITNGAFSSNLNGGHKDAGEIHRDIDGYFNRYNSIKKNKDKGYFFPQLPNPIGWMNYGQYGIALRYLIREYGYDRDHIISATIVDEREIVQEDIVVPAYTIAMEQLMLMDNHSVTFPDPEQEFIDKSKDMRAD